MSDFTARYLADYQAPHFSISTIDLTFDLADTRTHVTSIMEVKQEGDNKTLILQGEQLKLLSVKINDRVLSVDEYAITSSQLEISTQESEFTLTIETEISPAENTALEGLYKSGGAYCTQCEAEGFRRITYYLDRPDVMAIFTTKVIADKAEFPYLLSNGNKVAEGDLPDGKHFVTWNDPFPKPCYLFALVAGDFDLLQDNYTTVKGNDVALEIFVDKGNLGKAEHAMASLKHSMKWDEETFGLVYDLDIYMIVAVDFFNMGAMENKGLNVFNSKFVLADKTTATDTDYFNIEAVIGHEYFHNWTGNRITCRDWFQLSLKEGLTVFRDQEFSADMHSAAVTRIQNVRVLRSLQFAEDAGPMSHPIRPEKVLEMNNFYTLTVYEKGAEVIRMIHSLLGKDNFRKGMDLYFERFDGMAVTCDDFVNAMSDAANIDLAQFKLWYSQSGTPVLNVSESFDEKEQAYHLTISQSLRGEACQLLMPINIELLTDSSQAHSLTLNASEQTFSFDGFTQKPVLAFLGGFTAPVKVELSQSVEELAYIMVNSSDEFCRWDAGQKLLTGYIKSLVVDENYQLPESLLISYRAIIESEKDLALLAEQLTLPSFDELSDSIHEVDPIALIKALDTVKRFLAQGLKTELLSVYQGAQTGSYENKATDVAKRSVKNTCLGYLVLLDNQQALIATQYQASDNMTDTLATLTLAAKYHGTYFDEFMPDFESKWQETTLVMDKWFTTCAMYSGEDVFERLANLLEHPLFTLKNPNRARSLIGAFAAHNPKHFHCLSGKGYAFLTEQLITMNELNPQVASRLLTPLIQFKGFDKKRQALMKVQLEKLSALPNLSKDLKEKLDAALA